MKTYNIKVNGTSYFVEIEDTAPTATDTPQSLTPEFNTNPYTQITETTTPWATFPTGTTPTATTTPLEGTQGQTFVNPFGTNTMPTATNPFTTTTDFTSFPTQTPPTAPSTTTSPSAIPTPSAPSWTPNTTSPSNSASSLGSSAITFDPITGTYSPVSQESLGLENPLMFGGTDSSMQNAQNLNASYPSNFAGSWGTTEASAPNAAMEYGSTADYADPSSAFATDYDAFAQNSGNARPVNEFSFDFEPAEGSYRQDPMAPFATSVGNNSVLAPTSGRIDAVYVSVGDQVRAGDVLCMLEVEGIKSNIISPVDATVVGVFATVGADVDSHDILISLT